MKSDGVEDVFKWLEKKCKEAKENVKKAWLKKFVQEDPNNVGLDSAILMKFSFFEPLANTF